MVTKVHIKVNTGLSRLGVRPGRELDEFVAYIKTLRGLEIDGVFTHFADTGSEDQSFTLIAIRAF